MASQTYTDSVTLTSAAEFNKFDTAAYAALSGVAGTNTITATGPANLGLVATNPPLWFIPAATNTGATTLAITPSGGAALTAKNVFSGGAACAGGELVAGVPVAVVYDGTQYNILGGRSKAGVGTTFLGGDVALNNTSNYFNGPNTGSIGAAGQTWLILAVAAMKDTAGAAALEARIYDGANARANSLSASAGANLEITVSINVVVTLSAATTFTLQARDQTSTSGSLMTTGASGTANLATSITAVRIA